MSNLATNVDLVLIENKQLQDSFADLTLQLAQSNKKYNTMVSLLQTQYSFMNDIELRMAHVMKRDKPLKADLDRIRIERNDLKRITFL